MMQLKLLSKKRIKTGIIIFLYIVPFIIVCGDQVIPVKRITDSCMVFNAIKHSISSAFPGDYDSVRSLLSAIITSIATILTLILTIPLILLQSIYKYGKITEFFLKRIEIIQLLSFMFLLIFLSSVVLYAIDDLDSNIEDGSNLTGRIYFLAFYSILLFVFLLPFIYVYWRFCARFLSSRGLLGIIKEEKPQGTETHIEILGIVIEVLKKALDEGGIEVVREGCDYIGNVFVQLYGQYTDEGREFIFKKFKEVAKRAIESGPEALEPIMDLFSRFMKYGLEQNENPPYFERIFQVIEPTIIETVQPSYEEAIDNYFRRLMRFELAIRRTQNFNAADSCVRTLRNHQMRIISEWRNRSLGSGNINFIKKACCYTKVLLARAYSESLSIRSLLRDLEDTTKRSADYGPETMEHLINSFIFFMRFDVRKNTIYLKRLSQNSSFNEK